MRRSLALGSLLSVLAGVELAAGGLSHVAAGMASGFGALAGGPEGPVGAGRFVAGILLTGGGMILAGLVAWSVRARSALAVAGVLCPECGTRTTRVKRKDWQRLLSRLVDEPMTRRRCEACHWTGLSLRH